MYDTQEPTQATGHILNIHFRSYNLCNIASRLSNVKHYISKVRGSKKIKINKSVHIRFPLKVECVMVISKLSHIIT